MALSDFVWKQAFCCIIFTQTIWKLKAVGSTSNLFTNWQKNIYKNLSCYTTYYICSDHKSSKEFSVNFLMYPCVHGCCPEASRKLNISTKYYELNKSNNASRKC